MRERVSRASEHSTIEWKRANNRQYANEERNRMERRATLNQDQELAFGVTEEQNASEELKKWYKESGREGNRIKLLWRTLSKAGRARAIKFNWMNAKGVQKRRVYKALRWEGRISKGVIHDQGCLRVRGCEGNTMETSPQIQTKMKFKGNIIETSQCYQTCATKYHWKNSMSPKIHCKGVLAGSWSPLDL
jgi:D-mannonate dehydratase